MSERKKPASGDDLHISEEEDRLIDELTAQLREEPEPELDWDRIEASLMDRVAKERPLADPRGSGQGGRIVAFALAAAAVGLVAANRGQPTAPASGAHRVAVAPTPVPASPAAPPTAVPAAADAPSQALRPGQVVEAGDDARRVEVPGVVAWTLTPHSRARVVSVGRPHVIELEEGSCDAEVVPVKSTHALDESFVVQAGGTRVAVHGTRFNVRLDGSKVWVDVTRGSVSVGPRTRSGNSVGRVLVGPSRAAFQRKDGRLVPRLASQPRAVPRAPSSPPSAAPSSATPAPIAPPGLSKPEAQGMMVACLASAKPPGDDATVVTISSQVTLQLDGERRVVGASFSPPLRPDLQQRCAATLNGQRIAGSGPVAFSVIFR